MIPEAWLQDAIKRRRSRLYARRVAAPRPRDPVIKLSARRFIRVLQGMIAQAARTGPVEPQRPAPEVAVYHAPPARARKQWFGVDINR